MEWFEEDLTPIFWVGVVEDKGFLPLFEFDLHAQTVVDLADGKVIGKTGKLQWNCDDTAIETKITYLTGRTAKVWFRRVRPDVRRRGWISRVVIRVRDEVLKGWAYYPTPTA